MRRIKFWVELWINNGIHIARKMRRKRRRRRRRRVDREKGRGEREAEKRGSRGHIMDESCELFFPYTYCTCRPLCMERWVMTG